MCICSNDDENKTTIAAYRSKILNFNNKIFHINSQNEE